MPSEELSEVCYNFFREEDCVCPCSIRSPLFNHCSSAFGAHESRYSLLVLTPSAVKLLPHIVAFI